MSDTQEKKTFLFLDDDCFHPQFIRKPRIYYPIIGVPEMVEFAHSFNLIFHTTVEGACDYIERNGCPNFISFDNDLQRDLEGIHLARWLIEKDLDEPGFIPSDFGYFVHSQNPIAKDRIESLLNAYFQDKFKI